MMGLTSVWHWVILLVVVIVVFGTSKLKNAGKDLGGAVKGFKDAVKDEDAQDKLTKDAIDSTATETTKQKDNA